MDEEIQLSEQEKEVINKKRKQQEDIKLCSAEISEILKKYGFSLEITRPDIILVPNRNDTN